VDEEKKVSSRGKGISKVLGLVQTTHGGGELGRGITGGKGSGGGGGGSGRDGWKGGGLGVLVFSRGVRLIKREGGAQRGEGRGVE